MAAGNISRSNKQQRVHRTEEGWRRECFHSPGENVAFAHFHCKMAVAIDGRRA